MSDEIWKLGLCETATAIRDRKYTCHEVISAATERLHAVNPSLNAVTVDLSKEALEEAIEADSKLKNDKKSKIILFTNYTTYVKSVWKCILTFF